MKKCGSIDPLTLCIRGLWLRVMRCDFFITALRGMQTRSSIENSVCPSVRPSVKQVNCDKTEEKSVQSLIPCHSFPRKRMVDGSDPFYVKLWVNGPPLERNRTLPISPQWGGGLKPQKCRFPSKIALRLKKVCYNTKFLCVKTQRQSCKASLA